VADLDVVIFTFTQSECDAVNYLLGKYLNPVGRKSLIWRSQDMFSGKLVAKLDNNKTIQIEHKPLRAQGNVNAAAELARAANTKPRADYYIFYGCCGAIRHDHIGKVFRVNRVSYFSLGSVKKQSITSKSANPQPAAPPTAAATTGSIKAAKKGAAAKPTSATGTTKTVARQPTTPPVNPPPATPTKPAPAATTVESAKLKNKWFVYTTPNYQAPFGSIELPRHATGPLINLNLTEAFVEPSRV
jgi:nucleoside phosphorylase